MANVLCLKSWSQKSGLVAAILAFLIPLVARIVPEVLMGQYIVGFDTIGYYVPSTLTLLRNSVDFSELLAASPLIYLILLGLTSSGLPIVITLKVLGPLLIGFLGLVTYFYAKIALSWSSKKSLIVVIFSTLYFMSLRVSWDMFRSELSLIFLFLTFILLQKNLNSITGRVLISVMIFLVVFSHQLMALIMFAVLMAIIVSFYLKQEKAKIIKIIYCSIPAFLLLIIIISINLFVYSSPILGYSPRFSGDFEIVATVTYTESIQNMLGFLFFSYLPLLPLVFFGLKDYRKKLHINAWILWTMVPLLLVIINPAFFLGGVLPYRWIILLTYPLSFYAVEGLFRIKWTWYKIIYKFAVCSIIAFLSVSFIVLPNSTAIGYFEAYPTYVPKSMLQNTLQLSDCEDTVKALHWAKDNLPNQGHLLVHQAFYGWGTLEFDIDRLLPYYFEKPSNAAERFRNTTSNPLFLIWWVNGTGWYGQPDIPDSFVSIFRSGNIAIYNYSNHI